MADDPDLDTAYGLETPEDNLRLYGNWARTYDTAFVETVGYRLPGLVVQRFLTLKGKGPVLDVGCGTGAVGAALPKEIALDGLDLSPQMLAVAGEKQRYGQLIEANLKETLPIPNAAYHGLLSAGTFTHGHVGAEALAELARILAPGAVAVISVRDQVWDKMGFKRAFTELANTGQITPPDRVEEKIYDGAAPDGHGDDIGFVTAFRRL
jgi:predicted TPR repeat methyltransferase